AASEELLINLHKAGVLRPLPVVLTNTISLILVPDWAVRCCYCIYLLFVNKEKFTQCSESSDQSMSLFPSLPPEASKCKLCPIDWLSNGGKCYWVSKENKDWKRSHEDCLGKRSQMLMIQDQNEMTATQGKSPFWIGLHFTSPKKTWTWLNNSSLDNKLFPVSGPAKENSCGVIKGSQISSEICSGEFKWICQKEGVFL
uniref:C-type lectin domain-containing protein n=1 Tax=Terrapene triunguis TaxID=2587831 RepID=A0A674ISA5_9SAUR